MEQFSKNFFIALGNSLIFFVVYALLGWLGCHMGWITKDTFFNLISLVPVGYFFGFHRAVTIYEKEKRGY